MLTNCKITSYLPLLALTLLLACKKDDANPDTTGIRLFTGKMEITDVAVKARFLSQSSADFRQVPPTSISWPVKFSAPDTATFNASAIKYVAAKKDNQYLFYSPPVVPLSRSTTLLHDMLKYTAPVYPVPPNTGYEALTSEVRVGYVAGDRIQLSFLQYYWRQPTGWYYGTLFNELNENVATKVSPADTLAVRVSSVSAGLVR